MTAPLTKADLSVSPAYRRAAALVLRGRALTAVMVPSTPFAVAAMRRAVGRYLATETRSRGVVRMAGTRKESA